jgi:lauroyl/myristoyl acyltransferase
MVVKTLRGSVLLLFFYPLRWMVQCLPWRQALRVATLLGMIHARRRRDRLYRQIRAGISTVWPDALTPLDIERLVRRNLVMRYQHLINGFFYHKLDEALVERLVPTIAGRDHLDEALSQGKGMILLVSHFGEFGMLLAGLIFRGYRLHQIFTLTPEPHYRTWRWVERAVMRAKLQCWRHKRMEFMFWTPGLYLRPLYRKLREGAVVVLYGDGARGEHFTQANFLGYRLSLSLGPFRIAAKARVPLIPAFIIREAECRHRIHLEPPIVLLDDKPASLKQGVEGYGALLAKYVRTYPDHWFSWARLRCCRDAEGEALELIPAEVAPAHFYTQGKRQDA